jgi:hypothetical protein
MRRSSAADFQGNDRFEILSRLGDGGMGVVYEAHDRERQARVALKTLRTLSGDGVLRFKHEFRTLVDLQHPNLVTLGELHEDEGQWFFTMELVEGMDFLSWVRPPADPPTPGTRLDERRLRAALVQLGRGLGALHAAKKVHRDIKPSNVLVTIEGRVVLVDFGLSADVEAARNTSDGHVVGTADYMAPEQAASAGPGPEADWYSVGVMVYEALTGRRPFKGTPLAILMDKQKHEPQPPNELVRGLPDDLVRLCVELLRRDPRQRPSGAEVMRRLGAEGGEARRAPHDTPFVGRNRELSLLRALLDEARKTGPVTVAVEGESGVGKSAMVKRFTDSVADEALVLHGRCYERELVPYKAFDGVVDALSRHLMRLDKDRVAELLPPRVSLLGQVFPVLRGVEAVSRAPLSQGNVDPQELRTRVFVAMRQLLVTLSQEKPLLIVIDDLQWADGDSLALLSEVMRPPDPPRVLLVATEKSDEDKRTHADQLPGPVRRLPLERLSPEDARRLASLLLTNEANADAATIADDANGHPLFIDELCRHAVEDAPRVLHLEDALWSRISRLEPPARLLCELVAVAGAPIVQETACRAAAMEPGEFGKRIAALRATNLVRTTGARSADTVEPYHDRVRAAILQHLDSTALLERHERLALALASARHADPEALCVHWLGAGDLDKAAAYAVVAADQASAALAFERAARLYRLSLELVPRHDAPLRRRKLADALAQTGRGAEAARAYLRAAEVASASDQLDLRRRAAEQLLRAGHIAEGLETLETVLRGVDMHLQPTPARTLASLLFRRAELRFRGLGFKERDESQISIDELRRIDVCWSIAVGLALVDTFRGADFQTRHLILALGAGEPYRVARALAVEGGFVATAGGPAHKRSERLLEEAGRLAARLGHPHALGLTSLMSGVSAFLCGRWAEALGHSERAVEILGERCTGVAWELHNAHYFGLCALTMLGRTAELLRRMPPLRHAAAQRDDLYAAGTLRIGLLSLAALCSDDPQRAREESAEAIRPWAERRFQLQHYSLLVADVHTDLYVGDGQRARERIRALWPQLRSSLLLRTQFFRIEAHDLLARAALAAAAALPPEQRKPLLAEAEANAARVDREHMMWSRPIALLLRAGIAQLRGNEAGALKRLKEAEEGFATADMGLHVACTRLRRGRLMGGTEGAAQVSAAEERLREEEVRAPYRLARLIAPGFSE